MSQTVLQLQNVEHNSLRSVDWRSGLDYFRQWRLWHYLSLTDEFDAVRYTANDNITSSKIVFITLPIAPKQWLANGSTNSSGTHTLTQHCTIHFNNFRSRPPLCQRHCVVYLFIFKSSKMDFSNWNFKIKICKKEGLSDCDDEIIHRLLFCVNSRLALSVGKIDGFPRQRDEFVEWIL